MLIAEDERGAAATTLPHFVPAGGPKVPLVIFEMNVVLLTPQSNQAVSNKASNVVLLAAGCAVAYKLLKASNCNWIAGSEAREVVAVITTVGVNEGFTVNAVVATVLTPPEGAAGIAIKVVVAGKPVTGLGVTTKEAGTADAGRMLTASSIISILDCPVTGPATIASVNTFTVPVMPN